ncbi:MAG TPA: LysR family transcriptional regulator [Xanthobacteraceae bacterium]|nr:LysR family transcriptional regulator [Xanthobacteraceae bacterium]
MEMHQIRYFLAVARTLNFTQAAEECHVAQPSLSRAIRNLEEELGGVLFRRERSLSHLTELGKLMLPLLTQAYDSAQAAKTLATSYKTGTSAPLRLALAHTINLALLVPSLTELVKVFPGLELKFFRGAAAEIGEQLKRGDSELAVAGPLGFDWDRLDRWPLFEEGYAIAVNRTHALARRNAVKFADLAQLRLIARPYCEQAAELGAALRAQGIEQKSGDHVLSDHDLVALLQANVGVSVMPESAVGDGDLRVLPVDGLALRRTVSLYAVAGRERSPAGAALIRLLRAADWSEPRARRSLPA